MVICVCVCIVLYFIFTATQLGQVTDDLVSAQSLMRCVRAGKSEHCAFL